MGGFPCNYEKLISDSDCELTKEILKKEQRPIQKLMVFNNKIFQIRNEKLIPMIQDSFHKDFEESTNETRINPETGFSEFFESFLAPSNADSWVKSTLRNNKDIKVVVYGPSGTGKSSFGLRISKKEVPIWYTPSSYTEVVKTSYSSNNEKINIVYIIPQTDEKPKIIKANCYLVFFDLSMFSSFLEARQFILEKLNGFSEPIILVGNKCEKKNRASKEMIYDFCRRKKCVYVPASTLLGCGIIKINELIDKLVNQNRNNKYFVEST